MFLSSVSGTPSHHDFAIGRAFVASTLSPQWNFVPHSLLLSTVNQGLLAIFSFTFSPDAGDATT